MELPAAFGEQKTGLSTGAKIGIGCAVAAGAVIVLVCAGAYFGVKWSLGKVEAVVEEYQSQGYARVSGQVIDVTQAVRSKTVYFAQVVNLKADSDADLAFVAQTVEIHSTVNGDVGFFGQVITIHPGAVIKGNLNVKAGQIVSVSGTVEGQITGTYQQLDDRRVRTPDVEPAAPQDAGAPDAPTVPD
jgi:hypothetical protein